MLSAHFFLMVEYSGSAPVWSAGGTVLTVALLTPMPSGIPLAARIPTYRDLAGNVQTLPIEYEVKVSGTPDYWPFTEGIVYAWEGEWVEGDKDGIIDGGAIFEIQRMEVQSSSTFHLTSYETMDFIDPRGWDAYRRTSNAIQLLGYRETDMSVVKDVDLDPDVDFARLPWSVQTWAGTAMAVSPGSSRTIEYSMEVVAQEDLPLFPIELKKGAALWKQPTNIEVLWMDCWKQVLTYTMRESGSIVQSGTESMWFAPAIGRVRVEARQESPDGTYEESKSYLSGLIIPGWLEP